MISGLPKPAPTEAVNAPGCAFTFGGAVAEMWDYLHAFGVTNASVWVAEEFGVLWVEASYSVPSFGL